MPLTSPLNRAVRSTHAARPAGPAAGEGVGGAPAPPPTTPATPPRLGAWSSAWRYALVVTTGLALWALAASEAIPGESAPADVQGAVGAVLALDLLLGLVALGLLPLRRRRPVLVAGLTGALTAFSASAVASAGLAAVSMSTRRRWREVLVVGVVWGAAIAFDELVYRPAIPGLDSDDPVFVWVVALLGLVVYGACVATGSYIGARRELLASLRERALTAEREQALRAESAREAERARIAREMHDVLAHRMSLVAMHAGALAYRTDLTTEQTAQAAGVIRDNAHGALTELRGVLGVLRSPDDLGAEPPQPTLAELPALLADADDAGTPVTLDTTALEGGERSALLGLSPTVSRTAFRIVQEALTNARKHAPGAPVTLHLAGGPTTGALRITVQNPTAVGPVATPPGAGLGLVGLAERAALAGGGLEHDLHAEVFSLRAWLPWR